MRYSISKKFYKALSGLYLVALQDSNNLEIELALSLLKDVQMWQDGVDPRC